MEVTFDKVTVLSGCYDAFSLDTNTTWPPHNLTGHVIVIGSSSNVTSFCTQLGIKLISTLLHCV